MLAASESSLQRRGLPNIVDLVMEKGRRTPLPCLRFRSPEHLETVIETTKDYTKKASSEPPFPLRQEFCPHTSWCPRTVLIPCPDVQTVELHISACA